MWTRIQDWWRKSGDLQTLQRLDDRLLADMGLPRDGLRLEVFGEAEAPNNPCPTLTTRRTSP